MNLPDHRADRPQWKLEEGGWEDARIESMLKVLSEKDIMFEIGVEEGDLTALFVKQSGCDVVMFEPNERVYPCIRAIWEANHLKQPLDFYRGFLSNHRTTRPYNKLRNIFEDIDIDKMISDHGFKQLYENYPDVPQMTLDHYVQQTGIIPTVINMDVEGAEFEVIKGAENTIREHRPIIFMSIHPEFMYESYRNSGKWLEKYGERQHVVHLLRLIDECGYEHEIIEWDYHECHAKFLPI